MATEMSVLEQLRRGTINILFGLLAKLIPRNPRVWVFGSRYGFGYSDNSKYLFEYVARERKDIKVVWISSVRTLVALIRNKGFSAYWRRDLRAIWYCLRAGCAIFDHDKVDVARYGINGALLIQLWHGSPLRMIGFDDKISKVQQHQSQREGANAQLCEYNLIVSASDCVSNTLRSAFHCSMERIHALGYPRNDILLTSMTQDHRFVSNLKQKYGYKTLISYLPTYRQDESGRPILADTMLSIPTETMNEFLAEVNGLLVLRTHPLLWRANDKGIASLKIVRDGKFKVLGERGSRIVFGDDDQVEDFYPILRATDILVTDFSSVYFDFLLLNRPVVFAPFESDNVPSKRGLYYRYEEVCPGLKANSWEELILCLKKTLAYPNEFENERSIVRKRFNKHSDANSCNRVLGIIFALLQLDLNEAHLN